MSFFDTAPLELLDLIMDYKQEMEVWDNAMDLATYTSASTDPWVARGVSREVHTEPS